MLIYPPVRVFCSHLIRSKGFFLRPNPWFSKYMLPFEFYDMQVFINWAHFMVIAIIQHSGSHVIIRPSWNVRFYQHLQWRKSSSRLFDSHKVIARFSSGRPIYGTVSAQLNLIMEPSSETNGLPRKWVLDLESIRILNRSLGTLEEECFEVQLAGGCAIPLMQKMWTDQSLHSRSIGLWSSSYDFIYTSRTSKWIKGTEFRTPKLFAIWSCSWCSAISSPFCFCSWCLTVNVQSRWSSTIIHNNR